ncbi:MAG TPA: hypothetical protein VJP80_07630 [Candidatus Saccharimonadales bacterium]|nr:hypothetical protein [Candidatus Saccharimonadales bacterium]
MYGGVGAAELVLESEGNLYLLKHTVYTPEKRNLDAVAFPMNGDDTLPGSHTLTAERCDWDGVRLFIDPRLAHEDGRLNIERPQNAWHNTTIVENSLFDFIDRRQLV